MSREFDPAVLISAGDVSRTAVDDALACARRARLIERMPAPRHTYAFRHDVVRAVLYDEIAMLDRGHFHERIAAVRLLTQL